MLTEAQQIQIRSAIAAGADASALAVLVEIFLAQNAKA